MAGELGVGYETLLNHLTYSLEPSYARLSEIDYWQR